MQNRGNGSAKRRVKFIYGDAQCNLDKQWNQPRNQDQQIGKQNEIIAEEDGARDSAIIIKGEITKDYYKYDKYLKRKLKSL